MDKEKGAIELGTVILLFFLASLVSGSVLFVMSVMTYNKRNSSEFHEKTQAETILDNIARTMQELKRYPYDDPKNVFIESLRRQYDDYALDIVDISSGYHLDFLSDSDMTDSLLCEYLFINNSSSDFIRWRNANGLSQTTGKWRNFVKRESFDACVSYGWIPAANTESFVFRTVSLSWGVSDITSLFPLVNDFPLMNVNMINPDIIKPLIMRADFKIEKPLEKFEMFKSKLQAGPVIDSDIASIINIPYTHPLFQYLGTKTTFWKISLEFSRIGSLEGIVAAIPPKNGKRQEIEEYRLIDRRFLRD
jgi:hypothetical protein